MSINDHRRKTHNDEIKQKTEFGKNSNESLLENNPYTDRQVTPIGPRLKNARESLSLTITDIARQLRLADERIESLENDNYHNMPGTTFIKGYLRAYARLVNLSADELIADFERLNLMPDTKSFILSSSKPPILLSSKSIRWIIYLIGIGLLIMLLIWWNSSMNTPQDPNHSSSAMEPAKNAPLRERKINPGPTITYRKIQ